MIDLHNSGIGEFLVILAVILVCWLIEKAYLLRASKRYKNNHINIISNGSVKRKVGR